MENTRVSGRGWSLACGLLLTVSLLAMACTPKPGPGGGTPPPSVTISVGGQNVTASVPAEFGVTLVSVDPGGLPPRPPQTNAPVGPLAVTVVGATPGSIVRVTLALDFVASSVRKLISGAWNPFAHDGSTGATLSADGRTITLDLRDGGRGDSDGIANGTIVDPVMPLTTAYDLGMDPNITSPPEWASAMTFDGEFMWIATREEVQGGRAQVTKMRADDGQVVARVPVEADELLFDGQVIWASEAGAQGHVTRIRASDASVISTESAPGLTTAKGVFDGSGVWYGFGSTTPGDDDSVVHFSSSTGNFDRGVSLSEGYGPNSLAFDGAYVWTANSENVTKFSASNPIPTVVKTFNNPRYEQVIALAVAGPNLMISMSRNDVLDQGSVLTMRRSDGDLVTDAVRDGYVTGFLVQGPYVWERSYNINNLETNITRRRVDGVSETPMTFNMGVDYGWWDHELSWDGSRIWTIHRFPWGTTSFGPNRHISIIDNVDEGKPLAFQYLSNGSDFRQLSLDGTSVWVSQAEPGLVKRFRSSDLVETGAFPPINPGENHEIVSDGTFLYVAFTDQGAVTKYDSTGAIVAVTGIPNPAGVHLDGTSLWVTSSSNNEVRKLSTSDLSVLGSFPTGNGPTDVDVDNGTVWIANHDSDNVTKLRSTDGALLGTFQVGDGPIDVEAVGPSVWTSNEFSKSLSKVRASDGFPQGLIGFPKNYESDSIGSPAGLATDGESLWVSVPNKFWVVRVRSSDATILSTKLGHLTGSIGVQDGSLFIAGSAFDQGLWKYST